MKSNLTLQIPDGLSPSMEKVAHMIFGDLSVWKTLSYDENFKFEVLFRQSPTRMAEARSLIQNLLNQVLQAQSEDIFRAEALIGNILCFYVFFKPPVNSTLTVPQIIDGKWQAIDYRVEEIPLTPAWMGSPVEAYGLIPPEGSGAPPRLIFKGTTYPSDNGLLLQILTDLNPGMAAGAYLFMLGKPTIEEWMKGVGGNVWCCGLSLGGALTEWTAAYLPQWVGRGDAFNPPALYSKKPFQESHPQPPVNVYTQPNDSVSTTGICWGGENWRLYSIVPPQEIKHFMLSHVHVNIANPDSKVVELDRCVEESKPSRLLRTIVHQFLAFPFFVMALLVWLVKLPFNKK